MRERECVYASCIKFELKRKHTNICTVHDCETEMESKIETKLFGIYSIELQLSKNRIDLFRKSTDIQRPTGRPTHQPNELTIY